MAEASKNEGGFGNLTAVVVAVIGLGSGAIGTAVGGYIERDSARALLDAEQKQQERLQANEQQQQVRSEFLTHFRSSRSDAEDRREVLSFYSFVLDDGDAELKRWVGVLAEQDRTVHELLVESDAAIASAKPMGTATTPTLVPTTTVRPPATAKATSTSAADTIKPAPTASIAPTIDRAACNTCRDPCIATAMSKNRLTKQTAWSACTQSCRKVCVVSR